MKYKNTSDFYKFHHCNFLQIAKKCLKTTVRRMPQFSYSWATIIRDLRNNIDQVMVWGGYNGLLLQFPLQFVQNIWQNYWGCMGQHTLEKAIKTSKSKHTKMLCCTQKASLRCQSWRLNSSNCGSQWHTNTTKLIS